MARGRKKGETRRGASQGRRPGAGARDGFYGDAYGEQGYADGAGAGGAYEGAYEDAYEGGVAQADGYEDGIYETDDYYGDCYYEDSYGDGYAQGGTSAGEPQSSFFDSDMAQDAQTGQFAQAAPSGKKGRKRSGHSGKQGKQPGQTKRTGRRGLRAVILVLIVVVLLVGAAFGFLQLNYAQAMKLGDTDEAIAILERLGPYRHADEKVMEIKYNQATALGDSVEAVRIFEELGDYRDSAQQAAAVEAKLDEKYNQAAEQLANALEDSELEAARALFKELGDYRDSADQLRLIERYQDAMALTTPLERYEALRKLEGFALAQNRIDQIVQDSQKQENIQVGGIVWLGTYEQDNDTASGKEDIAWQVIAVEDGRALLLSEYGLDAHCFNVIRGNGSDWDGTCSLRSWLESDFVTEAGLGDRGQVTCLSSDELNAYLPNDASVNKARKCEATDYARTQGVMIAAQGECRWWLRSASTEDADSLSAIYVGSDGLISSYGTCVDDANVAVRPAFWMSL